MANGGCISPTGNRRYWSVFFRDLLRRFVHVIRSLLHLPRSCLSARTPVNHDRGAFLVLQSV